MSIIHKYKNRFFMTLKEKIRKLFQKKKKKNSNVAYPVHLSPFESDSSFYIVDLRYPVTKLNISLQTRELSTEQQDAEISFKAQPNNAARSTRRISVLRIENYRDSARTNGINSLRTSADLIPTYLSKIYLKNIQKSIKYF